MIKRFLLNWFVKDYFNGLTKEDVIAVVDNRIELNNHEWDDEKSQALYSNAQFLKNSRVHKELQNLLIYQAEERMFRTGGTEQDMLFGKALLFYIYEYDALLDDLAQRNHTNQ